MQKKTQKLQKITTLIWYDQYEKLLKMASEEDKKIAAIIRKALDQYFEGELDAKHQSSRLG